MLFQAHWQSHTLGMHGLYWSRGREPAVSRRARYSSSSARNDTMTTSGIQEVLYIKQSPKRQLRSVGIIAVILFMYVLAGTAERIPAVVMWLGVVVFGSVLLVGLFGVLKASRSSWELRLDRDGVTVNGYPMTPWTDVAEVRLVDARPRWMFALSRRYQFIAFVGKPGVQVPSLPSARGRGDVSRFSRARERTYGTQLVLPPSIFDASTDTVLRAVENLGKVPVERAR